MLRLPLHLLAVLLLPLQPFAQTVPGFWRKPASSLDQHDRLSLISGLLDTLTPTLNAATGTFSGLTSTQMASMLCAMSDGDFISSSTVSKGNVETILKLNANISSSLNSDLALWGLAAAHAYRAYREQTILNVAESMWTKVNQFMIQPADATAGTQANKTAKFEPQCNGASTVGGVFSSNNDPGNTDVDVRTTGAFLALSAQLYNATGQTQYQESAVHSAEFISRQMYDGQVILDTITLSSCITSSAELTLNSGFTIEGLSVLLTSKRAPNAGGYPDLGGLVLAATQAAAWTNSSDGIIIEGPASATAAESNTIDIASKGVLIRGLHEALARNAVNESTQAVIEGFITVQFNALLDLASTPGTNQYSPQWEGPPPPHLLPWGQLAALDVLNSAIDLPVSASSDSPSTSQITSSPATPTGSTQPTPQGGDGRQSSTSQGKKIIIAAAVIGAAIIIILVICLLIFLGRRREAAYMRSYEKHAAVPYLARPSRPTAQSLMARMKRSLKRRGPPPPPPPPPALPDEEAALPEKGDPVSRLSSDGERPVTRTGGGPTTRFRNLPPMPLSIPIPPRLGSMAEPLSSAGTEDLPVLIARLNSIMANLPPGGVVEEEPPGYA